MSSNNNSLALHLTATQGNKSLSLRDRAGALARRGEDNILLLDTSGSMSDYVRSEDNEHETKIQALWTLVQQLRAQGLEFKICEFNSIPQWSQGITCPNPVGGTALAEAIDFIASARPRQLTIITDGCPNNPYAALEAAKQLACKVNVLFVGSADDTYGQAFCKKLADACNGIYAYNDLNSEQLQLTAANSTRLMLTVGTTAKGPIAL